MTDRSMDEADIHVELLGLSRKAREAGAKGDRLMHDVLHQGIDRELDALDELQQQ